MKLALALVLIVAGACSSRPPIGLHGPMGQVFAWSVDDARLVLDKCEEYGPSVASILGVEPQSVVVWIERENVGKVGVFVVRDYSGRVISRRIVWGNEVRSDLDRHVAHELAHWYMSGTCWDALPLLVEEGVATFIELRLAANTREEREGELRARAREAKAVDWDQFFSIDERNVSKTPEGRMRAVYVLGLFLVDRVGIDSLRVMCERAMSEDQHKVPSGWVLEGASIGKTPDQWDRALVRWGKEWLSGAESELKREQ